MLGHWLRFGDPLFQHSHDPHRNETCDIDILHAAVEYAFQPALLQHANQFFSEALYAAALDQRRDNFPVFLQIVQGLVNFPVEPAGIYENQ